MSGTRSHSLKAPVTEALIVSHGQPSSPAAGEWQLQQLASKVSLLLPGWKIRSATLAAPGNLERELGSCEAEPFVYPVFMADGWFTKQALPDRIGAVRVHQLKPLGLHPGLPHRTLKMLRREAEQRGWSLNSCNIMIAAHGSETGSAASDCAYYFAKRLRGLMPFKKKIHTGFLAQEPSLSLVAQVSTPRTLLLPFLAGTGSHLTEDIPNALAEGGFKGVLLPAIGEADFVAELIAHSLTTARLGRENFDPLNLQHTASGGSSDAVDVPPAFTKIFCGETSGQCECSQRPIFSGFGFAASLLEKLQKRVSGKMRQAA
ncbi:CbiX/SirB N-terminal domain-containing protein [uncultured Roseibium sp.]|uniref:CbiX/SirB N-terminal domain-containing protein n=1 Tax=uncultured Roseibium sp. TaxID=1936171 RepID=UPI0026346D3A|nr:CbiX/SirB N-terminal domain-containing protein [uncultured Roseibium sp.]